MFVFYLEALCWDSVHVSRLSPLFQKLIRNALFGNMFGVLALQQSGRLSKASCPPRCPSCCIVGDNDLLYPKVVMKHCSHCSERAVLLVSPPADPVCCCVCVVALSQLGVVFLQEPLVVLGCVQLLQNLGQHRQHVKDLPSKTMMDILNEVLLLMTNSST